MKFAHEGILGERDSCGTGFVASTNQTRTHAILQDALFAVSRLEHRGAVSADGRTSDGAGVLTHIPHALLDIDKGVGVGVVFLPRGKEAAARRVVEQAVTVSKIELLRWRVVPTDSAELGESQKDIAPTIEQVLLKRPPGMDDTTFETTLLALRKACETAANAAGLLVSFPSMSAQTIVYKALVVPSALARFYLDLADPLYVTGLALFHQRYSTNTKPSWRLAQPARMLAHNGEINTLRGNVNRMRARAREFESAIAYVEGTIPKIIEDNPSDSLALDNVLEILSIHGRNPVHAMALLVPDSFESKEMEAELTAFYRYHALLGQPWDGPSALTFTNGRTVAAALDRNGLRPLRYWITEHRVIVGSEAGIVRVPEDNIREKGRLGPGQMLSVNTATGRVFRDHELKAELAELGDWGEWIADAEVTLPKGSVVEGQGGAELLSTQKCFGYGREHTEKILVPMLQSGVGPVGSMGDDTPLAALSENPQRFYRYFKQRFSQVTNPPIDPFRERMVMSLITRLGGGVDMLAEPGPLPPFLEFDSPVLSREAFAGLQELGAHGMKAETLDTTFVAEAGPEGMRDAIRDIQEKAARAVDKGAAILILSDRNISEQRAPIPMLLAASAIHQWLIEGGLRTQTALVCDTGDTIEDHDYACLIGFGVLLIHPYLALDSVRELSQLESKKLPKVPVEVAESNYIRAVEKGLLKIMAKYGISTIGSYQGAQTFEALGLSDALVDEFFDGTPTRIGGSTFDDIAAAPLAFHAEAFGEKARLRELGIYRFRRDGEYHAFNPEVFKSLHKAVREQEVQHYDEYARLVDDRPPTVLRDLVAWKKAKAPLPLDQVEPAESIVQRFCTQAMSFGSLSREAHETLAVAMNRIGGKSNSGEGGEEDVRFQPYDHDAPERSEAKWFPVKGDSGSSAIKQIASGRFGVTPYYLVSAEQLEIKMAQGSKPGEGGQIPGAKVTEDIAKTRRSVAGVTLISPPPHHDIYSIEDLAQLIYDLKRINSKASICVKLVSGTGIGTIAAGVTKGYADAIQISGHDGGTGASALASIKHAGLPWELGLAEVQQTLQANNLRGRVRLRVDGGLKTGRDVVMGALLGAEEFGFGTAPLVAAGCVMARQCHANTCPVGVATQRPELRKRYPGTPDHVIAFMFFVAEHVRHILAEIGVATLDEIVGRTDLLERRKGLPRRAQQINMDRILAPVGEGPLKQTQARNARPERDPLDELLLKRAKDAIEKGEELQERFEIQNRERSVGAAVSGAIARKYGAKGLPPGTIRFTFDGQAGQSFGVFCSEGMKLTLHGEAQDYVGKSMAGGEIIIRPALDSRRTCTDVLVGNTVLYGATGGKLFIAGLAGERFAVRNSGGVAVVEGCGDHGCEYMTGGIAVILGKTGYNFAAGMSGGTAFVYDPLGDLMPRFNTGMADAVRLADAAELKSLVQEFADQTSSPRAAAILKDWKPEDFWKIQAR